MGRRLKQLEYLRDAVRKHGKTDACLLWPYSTRGQMGYGQVPIGNGKADSVHRVAWRQLHGDIPKGKDVMHTCDTPRCFAEVHLVLGTKFDNMQDASRKGRLPGPGDAVAGGKNGRAVLTQAKVMKILERHAEGWGLRPLARSFGVGRTTVQKIIQGKLWPHLPRPNIEKQVTS